MYTLCGVAFQAINVLGLLLALPLLLLAGFSFDDPSTPSWANLAFVFVILAFPTLSLIGLLSKQQRYLGLIGLVLAVVGDVLINTMCHGLLRCHA